MQTLEQSASTIEGNNNLFVSAASKFNNNFIYRYPGQSYAEIPAEIPGRRHVERHVERPMVHCNHCCSRNKREPDNNTMSWDYEHHFAFMATMVDPNPDVLGDDNEMYHAPRKPVETPATTEEYTSMKEV
jgi:hypothetical protein